CVPLVGDGQSVATGKFRSRSPEQSKRGAGDQRQDTVLSLSLPEAQKLRFQGEKPLRCASRLLPPGSRNVAGPVSTPPAPAPPRCAGVGPPAVLACATATAATLPTSTRNRTGGRPRQHRQRVSGDLREKQNTERVCGDRLPVLRRCPLCAGVLPLLSQQPGECSGSWPQAATSPEAWTPEILEAKRNRPYGPRQSWSFSKRRSRSFRDRDF